MCACRRVACARSVRAYRHDVGPRAIPDSETPNIPSRQQVKPTPRRCRSLWRMRPARHRCLLGGSAQPLVLALARFVLASHSGFSSTASMHRSLLEAVSAICAISCDEPRPKAEPAQMPAPAGAVGAAWLLSASCSLDNLSVGTTYGVGHLAASHVHTCHIL